VYTSEGTALNKEAAVTYTGVGIWQRWLWAIAGVAVLLSGAVALAHQTTEMRASWRDLETWSNGPERGLGLHLSGPSGTVLVAFVARATGDVTVQASTGPGTNPNRVQTATLVFSGTDDRKRSFRIDLSSRLAVDNPAPGAQVTSGVAHMRASEYAQLSGAAAVSATVLGLEVSVRPDQLAAMRALR
jgi:hypothetical protein